MKLGQLDSPNPYISLFTRLGIILVVLTLILSIFTDGDTVWAIVPVAIVLGILALIYSRSFAKRK